MTLNRMSSLTRIRLLERSVEYYQQGHITPIRPMRIFDAAQVAEAFRYMQKGQHIGKIVVSIPQKSSQLETIATKQDLRLRAGSAYLLVGGLGGLGRAVASWMVERGAKHLIFLSRSAGQSTNDQAFSQELNAQGCLTQFFAGSAANSDDVKNAVQNAAAPIAGVMHMAMVLKVRSKADASVITRFQSATDCHRIGGYCSVRMRIGRRRSRQKSGARGISMKRWMIRPWISFSFSAQLLVSSANGAKVITLPPTASWTPLFSTVTVSTCRHRS